MRGRRQQRGHVAVISIEAGVVSPRGQELPNMSAYDRRVVSPLQARENERKCNNKYRSFLNLCSSSIACCKQCLIFAFCLIARNHQMIGMESSAKHLCPQFNSQRVPSGGLFCTPSKPSVPQGAWVVAGTDVGQSRSASSGRPGVWSGRSRPFPLPILTLGKPKGKEPKARSLFVEG